MAGVLNPSPSPSLRGRGISFGLRPPVSSLQPSVLGAAGGGGERVDAGEAVDEALFEPPPHGAVDFEVEGVAEKVVGACIFVEAADEVADGVDELLLPARGGVEQHVAGDLE